MTLSSRHRIRNSSPGGLRPSTLPLGHGGSPQYWLSHVDGEETFFVSFKPPRPGTEPQTLAWKAAVLTTTLGPPPTSRKIPILYQLRWQCWFGCFTLPEGTYIVLLLGVVRWQVSSRIYFGKLDLHTIHISTILLMVHFLLLRLSIYSNMAWLTLCIISSRGFGGGHRCTTTSCRHLY